MRRVAPVRPGIAASQKSWLAEKSKPIPVSITEVALQTCQTEKARNSASTEKIILRVATLLPDSFQKAWSSTAQDRKSTRLNSSHSSISYAVFCLKKKKQ